MKREIKFRGKRKDNGEWIYGYYVRDCENSLIIVIGEKALYNLHIPHQVIPESVGQYTGLKDKNGKEIYIGDVVQDKYDIKGNPEIDTGRIDFINGCTCVTYFDLDEDEQRQYYPAYNGLKYYEVIGNVHENPELIKEK